MCRSLLLGDSCNDYKYQQSNSNVGVADHVFKDRNTQLSRKGCTNARNSSYTPE
jgi:hypothetical protein